ncbi:hypothetical protein FBQ85_25510 [Cytophagia bacterium CHB2]|nr:hypothetical protein [Cytophagia bacterium CHB2]
MNLTRRKFCSYLACVTLVSQLLGLVFCGDVDCLQGGSDENCATLLCGLLAAHSSPPAAASSGANDSCQCFCHLLINFSQINLQAAVLNIAQLHMFEESHFFAAPSREIDHPPCV